MVLEMEETLEEIDWEDFSIKTIESAESMRSRYRVPTSCRSSSCFCWIWDRVAASTFRISDMVLVRKSDSASAEADGGMATGLLQTSSIQFNSIHSIQTNSHSLSLRKRELRSGNEFSKILNIRVCNSRNLVKVLEGWNWNWKSEENGQSVFCFVG